MQYRAIANGCGRFETGSGDSGGKRYAVEGSGGPGPGSALPLWLAGGFHRHEFYTRIRVFALTPNIQDKSRMRYVASGIMWRPACKPFAISADECSNAT